MILNSAFPSFPKPLFECKAKGEFIIYVEGAMVFFWEGHEFFWLGLRGRGLSSISAKMTKKEALGSLSVSYTANDKRQIQVENFKKIENEQTKTVQNNPYG